MSKNQMKDILSCLETKITDFNDKIKGRERKTSRDILVEILEYFENQESKEGSAFTLQKPEEDVIKALNVSGKVADEKTLRNMAYNGYLLATKNTPPKYSLSPHGAAILTQNKTRNAIERFNLSSTIVSGMIIGFTVFQAFNPTLLQTLNEVTKGGVSAEVKVVLYIIQAFLICSYFLLGIFLVQIFVWMFSRPRRNWSG